ncbi:MAG TPA: polysaccharide deacetylase family protein, partial [Acidimicrobiia bacterium]|nr:polysaccharide deacetylase family protein [Acidimicrobiia bacterium]
MGRLTFPRLVAGLVAVAFLAGLASVDWVAAAVAVVGGLSCAVALRHRSRAAWRRARLAVVGGATAVAVLAALALPTYRARPRPLVLNTAAPGSPGTAPALGPPAQDSHFTALGFVASDYNDSGAGVDRDAERLSTLAATGITLAPAPGSIVVHVNADTLVRAHLAGTAGLVVISNYDGTTFNGARAAALLASSTARHRFVAAVSGELARRGWDGVVLDLEALPDGARGDYPRLVRELVGAVGHRQVVVAVPSSAATSGGTGGFDLPALGAAAASIVLMAYDQHSSVSGAGPVAGMPWLRQTLTAAEAVVPRPKLLLGIAGYGYAWSPAGRVDDLTTPQAQALAAAPGSVATWDDQQQEWHVHAADGREVWYGDARSFAARARAALDDGLGGVALWRVGAEDPAALAALPTPPVKHPPSARGRPVQRVQAAGIVALTFDDGPDPQWTPRILDILRREHVPGTFFVVGTEAQRYPALVRAEVADGDVVGNHTYSHLNLATLPTWRADTEILGGATVIESIIGAKPRLFRPPYGAGDRKASQSGADQVLTDLHQHVVEWNDDPNDWQRPGAATITSRVLAGATGRTVVLLHDGGGNRLDT